MLNMNEQSGPMPTPTSLALSLRTCSALFALTLIGWGCGASGPLMEPEAAPLAPAAVESVDGLLSYLDAYGVPVVQVHVDSSPEGSLLLQRYRLNSSVVRYYAGSSTPDPLPEEMHLLDFGADGACSVRSFSTEQEARLFADRDVTESRDLRAPSNTDLLSVPASRNRRSGTNNPTFSYGRFAARCWRSATARQAFRALEVYARDAQEAQVAGTEDEG